MPSCSAQIAGWFSSAASRYGQLPRQNVVLSPSRDVTAGWKPSAVNEVSNASAPPAAPSTDTNPLHQPRPFHPLEVNAHAVGMQLQALCQFDCADGAHELAEEGEQARPGRLREHVIRSGRERRVHRSGDFTHPDW